MRGGATLRVAGSGFARATRARVWSIALCLVFLVSAGAVFGAPAEIPKTEADRRRVIGEVFESVLQNLAFMFVESVERPAASCRAASVKASWTVSRIG